MGVVPVLVCLFTRGDYNRDNFSINWSFCKQVSKINCGVRGTEVAPAVS